MSMIVLGFLITVLLCTILKEFKQLEFLWKNFHMFMRFIPIWSFFAPIPNLLDYHLLYRGFRRDGSVDDWKLVYKVVDKRPIYSFLWNPNKKFLKSLLDISHELISLSNQIKDTNQICVSLPYLHLLNYIDSFSHEVSIQNIQFMILTESRLYDYQIGFLSEVHPLTKR